MSLAIGKAQKKGNRKRDAIQGREGKFEWAGANYSAHSPDLPACVACADTIEDTQVLMREAMDLYVERLVELGKTVPEPKAQIGFLPVSAA